MVSPHDIQIEVQADLIDIHYILDTIKKYNLAQSDSDIKRLTINLLKLDLDIHTIVWIIDNAPNRKPQDFFDLGLLSFKSI